MGDVAVEGGVAPGARAVIDPDRAVFFRPAVFVFGVGEADLAHRDADGGVDVPLHVDAGGVGKMGGVLGDGGQFLGVVDVLDEVAGVIGALVGIFRGEILLLVVI